MIVNLVNMIGLRVAQGKLSHVINRSSETVSKLMCISPVFDLSNDSISRKLWNVEGWALQEEVGHWACSGGVCAAQGTPVFLPLLLAWMR